MKPVLLFMILFFSISSYAQKGEKQAYKIFTKEGKNVTYSKMLKNIQKGELLFFGELHNNPIAHWLQLEITQDIHDKFGKKLVLGAEMFEADNQLIINEYLQDFISVKKFESEVRLWNNYKTDYKPLMTFAKINKLPFIATNIPRRYASLVFNKGIESLNTLSDEAKQYIAPLPVTVDLELDCYKKMLTMMGDSKHDNVNFPHAQAIKDATMSHFILKNHIRGNYFIHFNGAYHSDNNESILWYIRKANKKIKVKTISTVSQKEISTLEKEHIGKADFIICVPNTMTKTH